MKGMRPGQLSRLRCGTSLKLSKDEHAVKLRDLIYVLVKLMYQRSMKISSLGLSAFYQTAQTLNMTKAAGELGLTQSALSQRIMALEEDLETTLFIREGRQIRLSEQGEQLLRYCQNTANLEDELLESFRGSLNSVGGTIRVAGYSSITESVVIPALAPFLRKNPGVTPDIQTFEMSDLPEVLRTGAADLVIMDYELNRSGVHQEVLGRERYVVIESKKFSTPEIFLDHNPQDMATEIFFKSQTKVPKKIKRGFVGNVGGIIEAVRSGLGRAVMSQHLIKDDSDVRVLTGFKKHDRPVTMHFYERPYYSRLFQQVAQELRGRVQDYLE